MEIVLLSHQSETECAKPKVCNNLPFFFSIFQTLQMDVNRLNITLLRIFRQGVAAALGLLPQQVHINRLIVRCLHFTFPEPLLKGLVVKAPTQ